MTSASYDYFAAFSAQEWAGIVVPILMLIPCLAWVLTSTSGRSRVERLVRQGLDHRTGPRRSPHRSEPERSRSAKPQPTDQSVTQSGVAPVEPEPASEPISAPVAAAPDPGAFNRRCKMDLAATRTGLELTVELPGVEDKDVSVQLIDDLLTISGHVSFEPDREEKNYRLIERDFGSFSRSIELPEGVPPDKIRATLNRGLLTVTIPNPTRPQPKTIPVQGRPMHLAETEEGYELVLDMPGLREADVEIVVSNGQLTVQEDRKPDYDHVAPSAELAGRGRARTLRSFDLPAQVDPDQISAILSNGVLKVILPSPRQPNLRKIAVRAAA